MHSLPAYAELHCLSNFTFLRGASHPEELAGRAHALGYAALAITDECSLAGVVRAHVAAKKHGLKLIIGTELQIDGGPKLVLLATHRESYGHISALITRARARAQKGRYQLTLADFECNLDGCLALWLPQKDASPVQARLFTERFPQRAWIAVEMLARAGDRARLARLQDIGAQAGLPCVASGDVHMHVRGRRRSATRHSPSPTSVPWPASCGPTSRRRRPD